jgi:ribosomal protein L15
MRKLLPLRESSKGLVLVTRATMLQMGILAPEFRGGMKILGDGEVTFPLEVRGIPVSKSAKEKIEKAGGVVHPLIP